MISLTEKWLDNTISDNEIIFNGLIFLEEIEQVIAMMAYVSLSKVSCTWNAESILNCKTQNAFGWKYSLTIKSFKMAHSFTAQALPTTHLLRLKIH